MNTPPIIIALAASLLLVSCAPKDAEVLRLTSPLPAGVVPRDEALVFTFSRGVVPPDSVNLWMETSYIEFIPAVPGKFVWQDTTRLVFSPDAPLPGDTRFQGILNTGLLTRMAGMRSFSGAEEFTFETEQFTLRTAEFFYDRLGDRRQIGIKANLEFTYTVDPSELQQYLDVSVDGRRQEAIRIVTTDRSRVIAVEVGTVTQLEKEREVRIAIGDGLISPETNTRLTLEAPFVATVPPLGELQVLGHESSFDGSTSRIRFKTSQEVDTAVVRRSITVDPVRAFAVVSDAEGFTLRGGFEPGTSFQLVVKKGLESVLGGKTQNDYEASVLIGNVAPSFRFTSPSGTYMLLGGQKHLEIKTVNLPRLAVRISQIYQNNLVFFLDQGRYYDYYADEFSDEESGRTRRKYRYIVGNYGRQLRYDTLTIRGEPDKEATTFLDLSPFLNTGYRGFYVVEVANPEEAWRSTSKLVSISDLGLIVKQSADEVVVFVTNLLTAQPFPDATVNLVSTTNQVIATGRTDRDGATRFSGYRALARDFVLKLVSVEAENDYNFLNLEDERLETSRFDVAGKRSAGGAYDAMVYGDRTIYRPGETIRLSGIVRDFSGRLPEKMPVRLTVFNPLGTLLQEQQHLLNEEGSFEASYQTRPASPTGEYRLDLATGAGEFLATYRVSLEDFVPDRLRISLTPSRETAHPGDRIRYELHALNFFGPPAAGRTWEFEGSFDILPYVSKKFPEFRFVDDAAKTYAGNPEVMSGTTDNDGRATIDFPLPEGLTSPGLLRARGRVAVFDESGRPVYQLSQVIVYPKDYFIGVKNLGSYYVTPNTPQKAQLIAVDANDHPIPGFRATVDIVRFEWHSVLRQHPSTGTLRYVSEKRELPVHSQTLTLAEKPAEFTYSVPRSGEYAVRIAKEGESGYNQFLFYAYRWGTTDITSFEVDPEARIDVVLDKEKYVPGERARVLFRAPFDGMMLVSVERNKVYSYRYLAVADNAASMEIPVEESYLPNVYISAVLFRTIFDRDIPLLVGHGIAPLMVERPANRIAVAVAAPERVRPRTQQKVTVTAGSEENVFVTLAAVDEGICQVKNYKTPDPYGHFYARKALETETFDFFRDLLPEVIRPKPRSSTGGGEAEMALRINPLGVQRFKPLAIWSGIRKTDAGGKIEVVLDIPEFQGELRLMALAYKGNRFGSAQSAMKVSDPVVVTTALPRFAAPGDSISMAITAMNTTGKTASLTCTVEASGGLVPLARSASLDVGPNQERSVTVPLRASAQIGKAVVNVKTEVFGETFTSTTELPVRPVSPFVAEAVTGYVDAGTSVAHEVSDRMLPYGRRASLALSPYPVANFSRELKHLIGYPHGCLEQTVSKAFPQIYLRDIAAVLDPLIMSSGSPTYFVNEGIAKVASLQMFDGTFMFWPSGGAANAWSTVYATHFLLEAKKAGYSVPEGVLKSALVAVGEIARGKKTEDYATSDGSRVVVRRIADKSCLYALYVLAVGGVPEKSVMNFYRTEKELLTSDSQYLLAGAFALSGDRRTSLELLPPAFVNERAARTSGGNFDSPLRANAIILNVLLETDLNNPNIPRYLEYLSRAYRSVEWYSTQDDAFTLLAFGKAARIASGGKVGGTVSVGGKEYPYRGGTQRLDIEPFGKKVVMSIKGEGRVYYSLVTEGIRADGAVRIEDRNLQIRREFLDRNGNPISLSSVQQNDMVVVRVTLNSSVDRLEHVAVTDLLPAGFEIENPRITETTQYAFIKSPATPEYIDIRDDRINLYTSFRGGKRQQVFYYAVRAVTRGVFQYPPIVAEAMYDGSYFSASGGGTLRISR